MDQLGALATLCGRRVRYAIKRAAVTVGRTGSSGNGKTIKVDPGGAGAGWAAGPNSRTRYSYNLGYTWS
jgi:hypothetical protein